MSDDAIIQALVNGMSIWTHVGKETETFKRLEPRAKEILESVRSEGWEFYRPDECQTVTVRHGGSYPDPHTGEEREAEPILSGDSIEQTRCILSYGTYHLVLTDPKDNNEPTQPAPF